MPTSRDLLAAAKAQITEITAEDAQARLDGSTVLDVREPDEYEQGAIPGAVHIPRGHLESQVESQGARPRRADRRLLRRRHPFGASRPRRCSELGYTDVVSMAGGFNKWKDEGRAWRRRRR